MPDNKTKCELKVTPLKERDIAQINIILQGSTWHDYSNVSDTLTKSLPKDALKNKNLFDNNTLFFEIAYSTQEASIKIIEGLLNESFSISKKQIFIKKLGGWFDF